MKELVVIILALDVIAEIFLIRRLRKEIKNAEETVMTHLKRAERLKKQLKEISKEYDEQAEILLDNASELRSENEELGIFKYNVTKILESNDFTYDQIDKIKELISDSESQN